MRRLKCLFPAPLSRAIRFDHWPLDPPERWPDPALLCVAGLDGSAGYVPNHEPPYPTQVEHHPMVSVPGRPYWDIRHGYGLPDDVGARWLGSPFVLGARDDGFSMNEWFHRVRQPVDKPVDDAHTQGARGH